MNTTELQPIRSCDRDAWVRALELGRQSGRTVELTGATYEDNELPEEVVEATVSSYSHPDTVAHKVVCRHYADPLHGLTVEGECDCERAAKFHLPCAHIALVLDRLDWLPFTTVEVEASLADQSRLAKVGADILLGKKR